jgi:hypothetical protein
MSLPRHNMLNSSCSAVESTVHEDEQHQYQQLHGDTSAITSGLEARLEEAEMALQVRLYCDLLLVYQFIVHCTNTSCFYMYTARRVLLR